RYRSVTGVQTCALPISNHLFGNLKVGDNPIAQRADGTNILMRFFMHQPRFMARSHRLVLFVKSYNRGLVKNNAFSTGIYEGVGSAQINGYIGIEPIEPAFSFLILFRLYCVFIHVLKV